MRKNLGIYLLALILLIPTLVWGSLQFPLVNNIRNTWSVIQRVGQITAIWGMLLLSIDFVLATRLQAIGKLFGGLNRVYIIHHLAGGISFVLLLLHPIFSLGQYLQFSVSTAAAFLIPIKQNVPIYMGIIALLIMIVLLILTFFVSLKYDVWKKSHKLFGVVLIPISLHIINISPSIQRSVFLKYYLLGFILLAAISYIYKTILGKFLVPKYKYTVSSINLLDESVIEIHMDPTSKVMDYLPGQFLFVKFDSLGVTSESHPFSISSCPGDKSLAITVKYLGDYTETLQLLKVGSRATIQGPFGSFSYTNYSNPKQIWIGGGIGLTPFVSMFRSLARNPQYSIVFIHVVKKLSEAYFSQKLQKIAAMNPNFTYWVYSSDKMDERISAKYLYHVIPDAASRDVFICGPPHMMKSIKDQFRDLGKKNSQIHTEEFSIN